MARADRTSSAAAVVTKGRTRPGRLARLDAIVLHREAELLARCDGEYAAAAYIDVGLGDSPYTTLESARAFRSCNSALRIIGVDIDPLRLARAQSMCAGEIELRLGGFALPVAKAERARLVRAMNVLRGYPETEVPSSHAQLAAPLLPGGLLVEGTSSRDGGLMCAHLIRKCGAEIVREAVCFSTDFSSGFAPLMFRDWLPRDLRRHVRPGEAIGDFLFAWHAAFERVRARSRQTPAVLFKASAEALARELPEIVLDAWLLDRGCLLWQPTRERVLPRPPL
jgi:hypothetical protein